MSNRKVIAHLTTAHARDDVRIFVKQCHTLAEAGFEVHFCVADGKGHHEADGILIHDVGSVNGRLRRFLHQTWRMFGVARKLGANLYHFHDPELLPCGVALKVLGKKVIYDVHEDVPRDILTKAWIPLMLRTLIARVFECFENICAKTLDGIVTATPFIRSRFVAVNPNCVDINNYPVLNEFPPLDWTRKRNEVCYVGGIASIRGIRELVKAMGQVEGVMLNLVGDFTESEVEKEVKGYAAWRKIREYGFVGRSEVAEVLRVSKAGLVTLHPVMNYVDALPVKMFEYMAAGIPVIASHFPLWKEIVEGNNCGICVDPLNPAEIADAIDWILRNSVEAEVMGINGQKAVEANYRWENEGRKLVVLYNKLLL